MLRRTGIVAMVVLLATLGGCREEDETKAPPPRELTRDAVGHYCGMIVTDHPGPKAQVFIAGEDEPTWFTSVRDAIVFMILPDEPKKVTAVYVNDMGRAESWDAPGAGTWIDAKTALFVIGSSRMGGMGAPEAVPFSDMESAKSFADRYGGEIVSFDDIPPEYVLAPITEPEHKGTDQ